MNECPFCNRIMLGEGVTTSAGAVLLSDSFPIAEGHLLVVPARHVDSLIDLNPAEQVALWTAAIEAAAALIAEDGVDGVNFGVNEGVAAGQTVPHVHLHVVPRRLGDVADPRGGCRWIIPERASYWEAKDVHSELSQV